MEHPALKSTANRYRYNSKEQLTEVEAIDYCARLYSAELCRWLQVDPLAGKYANNSPYAYCLNNPTKYIDPDGKKVEIHNMGKERNMALKEFLQTEVGRNYVMQFLKKGESVLGYDITATEDGMYSNSTLTFAAVDGLPETTNARTIIYHQNIEGKRGKQLFRQKEAITQNDLAQLQQTGKFEVMIALNREAGIKPKQGWSETIGHEVFQHAINDSKVIQDVINALKSVSGAEFGNLITKLNTQASNASEEHKVAEKGLNVEYNRYLEQLKQNNKH